MPLFLRAMRDHYPDNTVRDARTMDGYVALSGSYACGHIKKSAMVRSDHLLDWACCFGGFGGHGTVARVEEAKPAMAKAFRDSLARVGLAEIADARPGAPERKSAPPQGDAWVPGPPLSDLDHPVVIHRPRRMGVRSGELLVGLLREISRGPYAGQWTWEISGTRPNPKDFVWNGHQRTLAEAQAALTAAWEEWLLWAGLRQDQPPRWSSE